MAVVTTGVVVVFDGETVAVVTAGVVVVGTAVLVGMAMAVVPFTDTEVVFMLKAVMLEAALNKTFPI